MRTAQIVIVAFFTVAALMNGCANTDSRSASTSSSSSTAYGVIDAIETVHRMAGSGIDAGAVIGGAAGGVVGDTMADHETEKKNRQQDTYHVRVRLDNGDYQTMTQQSIVGLRVGDRIRIENDHVSRY